MWRNRWFNFAYARRGGEGAGDPIDNPKVGAGVFFQGRARVIIMKTRVSLRLAVVRNAAGTVGKPPLNIFALKEGSRSYVHI